MGANRVVFLCGRCGRSATALRAPNPGNLSQVAFSPSDMPPSLIRALESGSPATRYSFRKPQYLTFTLWSEAPTTPALANLLL